MNKKDIKKLIGVVSRATGGCNIQHNNCPCRTCFHNITKPNGEKIDYQHLSWLLLLALRGDYTYKDLQGVLSKVLIGEKV